MSAEAMDRRPGIRPRPSLKRRLDAAARFALPVGLTTLAMLALAAPLGLPAQAELQPQFVLASVFFWTLYRPASMPPVAVFLLGLLADLLGEAPPGVAVLSLLVVHALVLRWRRGLARQSFLLVWIAFAAIAIAAALLGWAATSLLRVRLLPFAPVVLEAMLGIGLYPVLAVLLIRAHRGAAAPELA